MLFDGVFFEDINILNPRIEQMDILKDASPHRKYMVHVAPMVCIITTKKVV